MGETPTYTLEELFDLLGFSPSSVSWAKDSAKRILDDTTGEPAWMFRRIDVKERESGCPELVISIPFGIKGL